MYDKMTPSAVTAPATQPRRHPSEAMASLRIVTHAVSSPCDKFASLYLPLEASDSLGSGEDYHISSRRKGWTRMLVYLPRVNERTRLLGSALPAGLVGNRRSHAALYWFTIPAVLA